MSARGKITAGDAQVVPPLPKELNTWDSLSGFRAEDAPEMRDEKSSCLQLKHLTQVDS